MGEMTHDREKVVKGLQCCMGEGVEDTPGCEDCPYCDNGDTCDSIRPLYADALNLIARPVAVWQYYTNDEGKARWRCSACGKICRRDPRDKKFCSTCGAEMRMEC